MNFTVKFLLLLSAVCVAYASSRVRTCITADDCKDEECCVLPRGLFLKKGICTEPSFKGDLCDPGDQEPVEGRYQFACPCSNGLTCQKVEETWGTTKYSVYECQPELKK